MTKSSASEKCILVIDDDPEEHILVSTVIKKISANIKVLAKTSERDVLHYFSLDFLVPKFILLDVNMPGSCGFKILQFLANNPKTKSVSVYMMSASEWGPHRKKAMDLGAAGYFVKPFALQEYQAILNVLIEQNRQPAALPF